MAQSADELRREIAQTRSELSGSLDAIGDRVSPGRVMERKKNRMVAGVQSVRERVMGGALDAKHAVAGEAHAIGARAGEAKHNASDALHAAPANVASKAQGAPIVAGAVAFGVGLLAAAAFPSSRRETELGAALLEKAEPLKDELKATGQEIASHLKEPVAEAASTLKSATSTAAHDVADAAKGATSDVRDDATRAVGTVTSDGTSN